MMNYLLTLIMLSLTCSLQAKETTKKKMENFFNQFDVYSNTTKADVVNGQLGGYATGGGVVVRNAVVDTKIVNIDLPQIEAGCGGIDLYSGGFSFISSDRLVEVLKKVGTNAAGYTALLAMETLSPLGANLVKQLQGWSNQINMASINSCETASLLVGGMIPKGTEASQHICRNMGSSSGYFQDFVSARHQCGVESVKEERLQEFKKKYPDSLVDQYNLAWEATHKLAIKKIDPFLGDLLMSLIGTVIVKKEKGENSVKVYPPQLRNENFFRAIVCGGTPKILRCQQKSLSSVDDRCIDVDEVDYPISYEDSWKGRVYQRLAAIQEKNLNDTVLSQEDIDFIALCDTPVLRFLMITNAQRKNINPIEIGQLSDWVAQDLLCKSLREAINNVRLYAFQLKRNEMFLTDLDDYLIQLDGLHQVIRDYETRNVDSIHKKLRLNELLDVLEAKMQSGLEL